MRYAILIRNVTLVDLLMQHSQPQVQTNPPLHQPQEKSKTPWIIAAFLFLVIIAIGGGLLVFLNSEKEDKKTSDTQVETKTEYTKESDTIEEAMIFKTETASSPDWIEETPESNKGPWHSALYISESDDGLNFDDGKLFLEHSGVANIILTTQNQLIATFQYFSFTNEEMFDVIAYATSDDFG